MAEPARDSTGVRSTRKGGNGPLFGLLALLLVIACVVGVLVAQQFRASERHIVAALAAAHRHGATASVEQCVDHVVGWSEGCRAMRKMCEWTFARMTHACLAAQDRRPYCGALTVSVADRRFGYRECKTRGATRGTKKKACANAYGRVASHCRWLAREDGRKGKRKQEGKATRGAARGANGGRS